LTDLPRGVYMLVSAIAIVLLAAAFVYGMDTLWLRTLFTVMQAGFLAITYLFLNYTTWFVDLTVPFTAAFAYFLIARFYQSTLVRRRNGHLWYSTALDPGRESHVLLLSAHVTAPDVRSQRRIQRIFQRQAGRSHYGAAAARLFGMPLLQDMYNDTMIFYWLISPARSCAALRDLLEMLERSVAGLRARNLEQGVQLALHAVSFTVDAEGQWRTLGKDAFVTTLTLAQHPMRGSVTRTDAFADLCMACPDVKVPATLGQAGLHWGGESASG
jgi:hypothetical protein